MASTTLHIFFSFLISISVLQAQASSKPNALFLPVSKDATKLQYVTQLQLGTPLARKSLVVDLGGQHLWMDCDAGYVSSSYKPSPCGSASCSVAKATSCRTECNPNHFTTPRCHNNTCTVLSQNTVYGSFENGEISRDQIAMQSTDGAKSGPLVTIPNFIFSCANAWENLDTLASGVNGMMGLGRFKIGMPTQLSSVFGGTLRRKFAICLPSKPKSNGVMFFGDSPYVFYPGYNNSKAIDVSYRFTYTKLYVNTIRTGSSVWIRGPESPEYFVKVTSILVDRKPIPINSTLLNFHVNGMGGTKISTVEPYTKLESSIYKALVKAFEKEIAVWNVTKVAPVQPFTDCYTIGNMGMTLLGLGVPDIGFEFENKHVYWGVHGANSMVEVGKDVACLAFLDGGEDPFVTTPIVIGGHQLQDNLLQFDLASSRLAFTQTLLFDEVECSNFKF